LHNYTEIYNVSSTVVVVLVIVVVVVVVVVVVAAAAVVVLPLHLFANIFLQTRHLKQLKDRRLTEFYCHKKLKMSKVSK